MAAIYREGSGGWPYNWNEDCDESFQKYKASVDKGKKVSATPFLAAQKLIYAKMGDPDDCAIKAKKPRSKRRGFKRYRLKSQRRFRI